MTRRALPQVTPRSEGLGQPTIMDRALAAQYGIPYVHWAAFAIDIDRVRDAVEDIEDDKPFGWEVFLTECYCLERLAPSADTSMIEDVVLAVLESETGEPRFGSQLPFAVWDAIAREVWPRELRSAFAGWKARPKELVRELAPLWNDEAQHRAKLAAFCLEVDIQPPLAPPTLETLKSWNGQETG